MSILRIFGYDANIATFEQKVGTDSLDIEGSTCDIDVQCRTIL